MHRSFTHTPPGQNLNKIDKILKYILELLIGITVVAIVLILFAGVILRYVLKSPLFWAEEVTVLGLIWITFLGGAMLVRQDKHVAITFAVDRLKPSTKTRIRLFNGLLINVLLAVMVYQSWMLVGSLSASYTPAVRISDAWFGWASVAGFSLMLFYQMRKFLSELCNRYISGNKSTQKADGKFE